MSTLLLCLLALAPLRHAAAGPVFSPQHRVPGIGVARSELTGDLLDVRTEHMVQSQTFAIMRDPEAVSGARRITSARLQSLFTAAARSSGWPASLLESIAYLESWGEARAESHSGPRGVMQISEATARRMGLRIVHATRYHVTAERVPVKRSGKTTYRTVRHKTAYTVTVRDDRLVPERAIPAAARYLAAVEQRLGGRDWAIFAYHCGEGCAAEIMDLARRAHGIPSDHPTVARTFFSASPAWNRDLYLAIQRQMDRDYSPTYWFRVQRAGQLLALYRRDPAAFAALAEEYHSRTHSGQRAPHRLSVWLKKDDLLIQHDEDLRDGSGLVTAPDNPDFLGYTVAASHRLALPAAVGTLTYIAWETRRLYDALQPGGEDFRPLEVTAMVQPADRSGIGSDSLAHSSGQVFDIGYAGLPARQRECLSFILQDLGWHGYLGFVEEGAGTFHIGCSPTSRDFFSAVYREVADAA